MPGRMAVLAALLLLLPGIRSPVGAQVAPASPEVVSITFEGAAHLPEALLRLSIGTQQTQCASPALRPLCWLGWSQDRRTLDPRMLATDLIRLRILYYQAGFREAYVALDTLRTDDGMHVRFRIQEGEPHRVAAIEIEGAQEFDRGLTRNLPLRTGEPLSMLAFEATRDTLIARMANRGHAAADVLANYDIAAGDVHDAHVAYTLIPGERMRFGEVTVTGTRRVSPDVVRNMLLFKAGDPYTRQVLASSQRNLFTLELLRHAEIVPDSVLDSDTIVPVEVRVVEGDLHRARVAVGLSTSEYLNAEGRFVARNLFGSARRLELRARVSNIAADQLGSITPFEGCTGTYCDLAGLASADYTRPWLLSPLNTGAAGGFVERITLPGVYVRTTVGGHVSLRRTLGPGASATFGWRPELTRLESDGDLIFCVNFTACEERDIDVLRRKAWLAPLAVGVVRDRANNVFYPTAGTVFRTEAEFASGLTASEQDYFRISGEGSLYHDPFRGVVLASRLRAGWARSLGEAAEGVGLHPQKRFFAGGPNSVRGYAQYRLGPKLLTINAARELAAPVEQGGAGCTAQQINAGECDVSALAAVGSERLEQRPVGGTLMIEGNMEVRFPLWRDLLRGAAFLDFGQVWRSSSDASVGSIAWTPGAGIRYFSPIGPVRIDVGYNPGGGERVAVISTEVCDNRDPLAGCVDLDPDVQYEPGQLGNRRKLRTQPPVDWRPYRSFRDRLQFHFSIGQAF